MRSQLQDGQQVGGKPPFFLHSVIARPLGRGNLTFIITRHCEEALRRGNLTFDFNCHCESLLRRGNLTCPRNVITTSHPLLLDFSDSPNLTIFVTFSHPLLRRHLTLFVIKKYFEFFLDTGS